MPREERMFGDVVDRSVKVRNRQGVAVLLTVALETAVVSVLIVVPLMAIDVLPTPDEAIGAFVVQPPAPAAPSPPQVAPPSRAPSERPNPEAAPVKPPDNLLPELPPPHADFEAPAGVVIMSPGAFGGVEGGVDIAAPPPSPPPPAPVRVGGGIRPPEKMKHVNPLYPAIAQSARVQGTVIIEATIDRDGTVAGARVLRGHPLLDGEALAAVRQWEFTPTLLNGVPTPVIMTVTVNFRLN